MDRCRIAAGARARHVVKVTVTIVSSSLEAYYLPSSVASSAIYEVALSDLQNCTSDFGALLPHPKASKFLSPVTSPSFRLVTYRVFSNDQIPPLPPHGHSHFQPQCRFPFQKDLSGKIYLASNAI